MNDILEEIRSIPGIIGGFIFSTRKGLLTGNLPAIFKKERLVKIGKMLAKVYAGGRTNFPDITEISLCYEESLVIIRQIGETLYLIFICDPGLNVNLLTMSMNLIEDDLRDLSEADFESPSPATPSDDGQPDHPEDEAVRNLLTSGPLSEVLKKMEAALTKVVGPMSGIIFADALTEWLASGSPSYASLSNLIKILAREISDPEKISDYRQLITPYLAPREENRYLWRGGERKLSN